MLFFISVDAGGSKCSAILFDENFKLLGRGLSGGVNASQGAKPEHVRKNVGECLSGLFKDFKPERIEICYTVFVGNDKILYEELTKIAHVKSYVRIGETEAGLYAGALVGEGLLALSGTGATIGYIQKDPPLTASVGGWGPILGDHGSGAWIGQKALRAVVAEHDGWGEPTALTGLIKKDWGLEQDWGMVNAVYQSEAPFRKAASVAPLVGKAARAGDSVALNILHEAGELMAMQASTLIKNNNLGERLPLVVCCGGAWKTHPTMFETFCDRLSENHPGIIIEKPWFEHVVAGAAYEVMKRGYGRDEGRRILIECFADYVIKW